MACMRLSVVNVRNFIFGVEDSLVSTVGLLSGIAIAGSSRETVLLTGAVLIFVEAFSMAAGSFLSEASAEEYESRRHVADSRSRKAGAVMFVSYFAAGFVPLAPYLFVEFASALKLSIALSLSALLALGLASGRMTGASMLRSATRTTLVGGTAIMVGAAVGLFVA